MGTLCTTALQIVKGIVKYFVKSVYAIYIRIGNIFPTAGNCQYLSTLDFNTAVHGVLVNSIIRYKCLCVCVCVLVEYIIDLLIWCSSVILINILQENTSSFCFFSPFHIFSRASPSPAPSVLSPPEDTFKQSFSLQLFLLRLTLSEGSAQKYPRR